MNVRNANGYTEMIENEERGNVRWQAKWGPILEAEKLGKPKPGDSPQPPPTAYSTKSQVTRSHTFTSGSLSTLPPRQPKAASAWRRTHLVVAYYTLRTQPGSLLLDPLRHSQST